MILAPIYDKDAVLDGRTPFDERAYYILKNIDQLSSWVRRPKIDVGATIESLLTKFIENLSLVGIKKVKYDQ